MADTKDIKLTSSVQKDPNFAVICSFLTNYGTLLGLTDVSFDQLEKWIEDTRYGEWRVLPTIIRPRRSRSAEAYSHQTFPCTICRSVCLSVGRSVGRSVRLSSALWKNGRSQPAAVRHHRSDGSTDEPGIGAYYYQKGPHCNGHAAYCRQ